MLVDGCSLYASAAMCINTYFFDDAVLTMVLSGLVVLIFVRLILAVIRSHPW